MGQPSKAAVALPETVYVDKTPERIAELKKDLVARLTACESAGHKEDDAIIMYDNNQAPPRPQLSGDLCVGGPDTGRMASQVSGYDGGFAAVALNLEIA